eukprot:COSAG02_NODE_25770_length_649_cov_1.278182_2_plen_39_part_01
MPTTLQSVAMYLISNPDQELPQFIARITHVPAMCPTVTP